MFILIHHPNHWLIFLVVGPGQKCLWDFPSHVLCGSRDQAPKVFTHSRDQLELSVNGAQALASELGTKTLKTTAQKQVTPG